MEIFYKLILIVTPVVKVVKIVSFVDVVKELRIV